MVELNVTVWVQMANFIVLIFVLNIVLFKPILGVIEGRKKRLEDLGEEVKSLETQIDEKMADYEEKLRQARQEAMNERNEIQQKAAEDGKTIMGEARSEISVIIEDFKNKLDKEMTGARNVLKSQSEKISREISEKVLGRSIQ
jgi:F-type H+-transporting ATPase subunit b